MPSSERLHLTLLLVLLCLLLSTPSLFAQDGGQITQINSSGQTVSCVIGQNSMLDPDGNCSIAATLDGTFTGNGTSELSEFEALASGSDLILGWTEFKGLDLETSGDTYSGGPCNGGDLVADGMSSGSFAYYSIFEMTGNQYIAFRVRAAQNEGADHGFSILLSNDGLLGGMGASADTNYVFGNAGFEKEIRFKAPGSSNPSLAIYDVDGLHLVDETYAAETSFSSNWQIAYSEYNAANCSGTYQATFYTIYLPITALGISGGANLNDLSFIVSSTTDGKSFFSNAISDLGGLIGFGLTNPCNCSVIPGNCTETYADCMISCLATKVSINSNFPVEWQAISAEIQDESIMLRWEVSKEVNNDYFTVERQIGEGAFEEIGRIQGRGTADSPMEYRFTDPFLIHDQLYYRVKQSDFDGNFSFSPIVNVRPEKGQEIAQLINQPGIQSLGLQWFAPEQTAGFVSVLDVSGKEYQRVAITLQSGHNHIPLTYPNLPKGIYILQVLDPVGYPIFAKKFIWQ
ncbi:MAG: T9SS type A sorting domain-containing protein [Bacteroidota bacterium]